MRVYPVEDYPVPHNNGRVFLPTYTAYIPHLIEAYLAERKKAEKIFSKFAFDLIISDSRSGVFSHHVPSIQITHQLHREPSPDCVADGTDWDIHSG